MRTPVCSTSRWSKPHDTLTQQRNFVHKLPLPWRSHFCSLTADFSKPMGFPACTYPHTQLPSAYNAKKLWYGKDNSREVWQAICYLGSHKMNGTMLTLFTVATRTAQFFIMQRMCYEIRGNHVINFPIATIHFELITSPVSWQVLLWTHDHVPAYCWTHTTWRFSRQGRTEDKRHRRVPVPCAQPGCPTTWLPTLPTTGTNLSQTF